MEKSFTNVYETKEWGNNNNSSYNGSSGEGSTVEFNKDTYVPFLKKFIIDNNIKTVNDLGCGDFLCGKLIYDDLDVSYTGYDTYKKIIDYNTKHYPQPKYTFIHLDFFNNKEAIKNCDLCILKDVIQHWSCESIYIFLDYLLNYKKIKYILLCNDYDQKYNNQDTKDGGYRPLNLKYYPLKKYEPIIIFKYNYKEIYLIGKNKNTAYYDNSCIENNRNSYGPLLILLIILIIIIIFINKNNL
jgi:hypothetical protein